MSGFTIFLLVLGAFTLSAAAVLGPFILGDILEYFFGEDEPTRD